MNDAELSRSTAPLDAMFPRVVQDSEIAEHKLVGFIAYGLYEEAKREWVSDFYDREGRYPELNDLRDYERSWTASRVEGLRSSAVQVVAAYADSVATGLESEILRRELKGRFWRSVGRWLFSAAIFVATVIGAVAILHRLKIDVIDILQTFARPEVK